MIECDDDVDGNCEHGDHPAPRGKRFCSMACAECEQAEHDATKSECAGVCLRDVKGGGHG